MLLKGKKLTSFVDYVVLKREGGRLIFKVEPIKDWDAFDKIYPLPEPPKIVGKGGKKGTDLTDKRYQEALVSYETLRSHWIILTSLTRVYFKYDDDTEENIEWEKVKMSDVNTWGEWHRELIDSGITLGEIANIKSKIVDINGLNQSKLNEARDDFLAGLQEPQSV